jgi:hypothetical protein
VTSKRQQPPLPWLEWLLTTTIISALAALLPWHSGYLGWSWDALNHHVYLGLTADSPRWHLDVMPASVQTYQYPYLYWPVYQLSQWQGSAAGAAALWSAFQAAMLAVPVWLISFRLLPEQSSAAENTILRLMACASAFMSMVVLAGLQTTANDLLVAVPLLWALALSLHPSFNNGRATAAASLVGAAIAFKLSSGLFLPWLLLWCWTPQAPRGLLARGALIGSGAALGFLLAYLPWGWQLWRLTGNPMHPFFGPWLGGLFGGP